MVVLSGGMDSATALGWAVNQWGRENVSSVTFNYGSRHNARENFAARHLARHYGVNNIYVVLPLSKQLKSALTGWEDVPHGHYADENMKKTVVPFRNGIMLSIAAGVAESRDVQRLVIGNHAGDHAIYPDCREAFMRPMAEAIKAGTWTGLELSRPFETMTKNEIVALGITLSVPYGLTYSCYEGNEQHCGRCGTCVERLEAFDRAGIADPVAYLDREYYRTIAKPVTP